MTSMAEGSDPAPRRLVPCMGRLQALGVLFVAGWAVGCSSFETSVEELKGALALSGEGANQTLEWRREVERLPWYARGTVSRFVFHSVLGSDRTSVELDNPSQWARERIELLSEWAGDSLARTAEAAVVLTPVVERDVVPLNRVFALEQMGDLLGKMQGDLRSTFETAEFRRGSDPRQAIAKQTFEAFAPSGRATGTSDGDAESKGGFSVAQRRGYVNALAALVEKPLLEWWERHRLLTDLAIAWEQEPDPELKSLTAQSLRVATWHALVWGVTDRLKERGRVSGPARRTAVRVLHRLGGPDIVPHLLALLEIPGAERVGNERFEDDSLGQLQLVHMCGQLDLERGLATASLALLENREGPAPVELLCEYALLDPLDDPSNRRLIAMEALSVCLQREVEFDDGWVVAWYQKWAAGEVDVESGEPQATEPDPTAPSRASEQDVPDLVGAGEPR